MQVGTRSGKVREFEYGSGDSVRDNNLSKAVALVLLAWFIAYFEFLRFSFEHSESASSLAGLVTTKADLY